MGFNRREMESRRKAAAEKEAAARRALDPQILEDAARLVAAWNERQAGRMPLLFAPTIGAAITAGYWFLRARCPASNLLQRRPRGPMANLMASGPSTSTRRVVPEEMPRSFICRPRPGCRS
jgi:hypothetical protein